MASVTVSPADATIPFGTATQFDATVKDAAGNELTDRTVTWSSSDNTRVTVDSTGLVTGVGPGSATITATADGRSDMALLTVTPLVFSSISAGSHTCGLTTQGSVYCWGSGALGSGSIDTTANPVPVLGGLTFQSLSAGLGTTCGLTVCNEAYCWGRNVGNGLSDTLSQLTPMAVAGGLNFASVDAAAHTCGVTIGGAAHCWGNNFAGQLGDG